jgi:hypothetical protein
MAKAADTILPPIPQNITALALALSVVEIAIVDLTHQVCVATSQDAAALIELLDMAEGRRERLVDRILTLEAHSPSEALEKMRAFLSWQRHAEP